AIPLPPFGVHRLFGNRRLQLLGDAVAVLIFQLGHEVDPLALALGRPELAHHPPFFLGVGPVTVPTLDWQPGLGLRQEPNDLSSEKRFFTSNLLQLGNWIPNPRAT